MSALNNVQTDTLYHSFDKILVDEKAIFPILDSLIDESKNQNTGNFSPPFYGFIYMEIKENLYTFSFSLSNDHNLLNQDDFFVENINGAFNYKNTPFFVLLDSKETKWTENYLTLLDEKMKVFSLKYTKDNAELIYPTAWIKRIYTIKNNELVFKSSHRDLIDSEDYVR